MLKVSPKNAHVPTHNGISARSGVPVWHSIHPHSFERDPTNPHSPLGFANRRGISRGFLHRALSNACPTGNIEIFYARAAGQASNKAKRSRPLSMERGPHCHSKILIASQARRPSGLQAPCGWRLDPGTHARRRSGLRRGRSRVNGHVGNVSAPFLLLRTSRLRKLQHGIVRRYIVDNLSCGPSVQSYEECVCAPRSGG